MPGNSKYNFRVLLSKECYCIAITIPNPSSIEYKATIFLIICGVSGFVKLIFSMFLEIIFKVSNRNY